MLKGPRGSRTPRSKGTCRDYYKHNKILIIGLTAVFGLILLTGILAVIVFGIISSSKKKKILF